MADRGARAISNKYGGRGARPIKGNSPRLQAKAVVQKLINIYGKAGTKKILAEYMRTNGRGSIGKILGGILSSILPF